MHCPGQRPLLTTKVFLYENVLEGVLVFILDSETDTRVIVHMHDDDSLISMLQTLAKEKVEH